MKRRKVIMMTVILFFIALFLYFQNNWIGVTHIHINFSNLGESFHGFKILHLSDLHNKEFGKGNSNLVKVIKDEEPDIIVITGDLVDSRRYREEPVLELIEGIAAVAPVYYVTGNHEVGCSDYSSLERRLKDMGVKVLRNSLHKIARGEDELYIGGIDDPLARGYAYNGKEVVDEQITKALGGVEGFKILLSHRPEMFPVYVSKGVDLTFSGHAHGGQIRLPFIGGLFAPGQGFFPKYTSGAFEEKASVMVVSRGLGNSVMPLRIFNPPEVVVVTITNTL